MRHAIFLKRFEYSIPVPGTSVNSMGSRESHPFEMQLPLVNVNIDFEKKNLFIEINSLLLMTFTRVPELTISDDDKEKIRVKANFHANFNIDLSGFTSNDLVFPLKGIIEDGKSNNSCSGLLVLDSTTSKNWPGDREWYLTVYLNYDYDEEREIKLRLPLCSLSDNAELN